MSQLSIGSVIRIKDDPNIPKDSRGLVGTVKGFGTAEGGKPAIIVRVKTPDGFTFEGAVPPDSFDVLETVVASDLLPVGTEVRVSFPATVIATDSEDFGAEYKVANKYTGPVWVPADAVREVKPPRPLRKGDTVKVLANVVKDLDQQDDLKIVIGGSKFWIQRDALEAARV